MDSALVTCIDVYCNCHTEGTDPALVCSGDHGNADTNCGASLASRKSGPSQGTDEQLGGTRHQVFSTCSAHEKKKRRGNITITAVSSVPLSPHWSLTFPLNTWTILQVFNAFPFIFSFCSRLAVHCLHPLQVLDASWYMPAEKRDPFQEFQVCVDTGASGASYHHPLTMCWFLLARNAAQALCSIQRQ